MSATLFQNFPLSLRKTDIYEASTIWWMKLIAQCFYLTLLSKSNKDVMIKLESLLVSLIQINSSLFI